MMSELDKDSFAKLMEPFSLSGKASSLAVACSGGPDSMALTMLLKDWCTSHLIKLTALIVDHALRPESAEEAQLVKESLQEFDITCVILSDPSQEIEGNIQGGAREFRYGLMLEWCRENACAHLAIAHHQEDQAETFLLRLARGSGVSGLAAMASEDCREGVQIIRPLLPISKQELIGYLTSKEVTWVEDPSNQLEKFDRVKLRNMSGVLSEIGLTPQRLTKTADVMRMSQEALDWSLIQALKGHLEILPVGGYRLESKLLLELPEALRLKALSLMISSASGNSYPPDLDKLYVVQEQLLSEQNSFAVTSHGAHVKLAKGRLWIGREASRVASSVPLKEGVIWDGRFQVTEAFGCGDIEFGPLGLSGWQKWAKKFEKDRDDCPYPAFMRQSLCAVYLDDELIAPVAPLFGEDQGEIEEKLAQIQIHFTIPKEFATFTFSSALSDTM